MFANLLVTQISRKLKMDISSGLCCGEKDHQHNKNMPYILSIGVDVPRVMPHMQLLVDIR